VAYLHESLREDMLEESPHELHDIQGHDPPSVATGFLVAEPDLSILDLDDAAVGNGHLEDIGCEVFDGIRRIVHGLAVDIEGFFPDSGIYLIQKADLFELIAHLGPKDF
jgi:hypothetical protein